jgi:hypothetical protein
MMHVLPVMASRNANHVLLPLKLRARLIMVRVQKNRDIYRERGE